MFLGQQNVEAAFETQVEGSQAAGATQVELVHAAVMVSRQVQLTHTQPFDIEHDRAPAGQVDAADLLVRHRLAIALVAVHGKVDGHAAAEPERLIEESWNP